MTNIKDSEYLSEMLCFMFQHTSNNRQESSNKLFNKELHNFCFCFVFQVMLVS